jgi:hypothetical protein
MAKPTDSSTGAMALELEVTGLPKELNRRA